MKNCLFNGTIKSVFVHSSLVDTVVYQPVWAYGNFSFAVDFCNCQLCLSDLCTLTRV